MTNNKLFLRAKGKKSAKCNKIYSCNISTLKCFPHYPTSSEVSKEKQRETVRKPSFLVGGGLNNPLL